MEHQAGDLIKFTIDGLHTSPQDKLGLVIGCSRLIPYISDSFSYLQVLHESEIYLINPRWAFTVAKPKVKT